MRVNRGRARALYVGLCRVEHHFRVEVRRAEGGTVLALFGELDLASSPALEHELEDISGEGLVIADLRELEFIDSTGLSVLVRAHRRAREHGSDFAVVKGPGQVHRLLSLTGVGERLRTADSPEELLDGG